MNPTRGSGRVASRRGRRCVPSSVAPLESRQLMAAGGLGINLAEAGLDYVDVMRGSGAWTTMANAPVPTDADGWPLADAQVSVLDERVNQPWNGPDPAAASPDIGGTYHLSFQGRAKVAPAFYVQNFYVQNQVYDAATNTTTADVVVYHHTLPFVVMTFTDTANPASPTGAGVAKVRLIQPGYDPDTTQVYTDNLINALGPFDTVRYLNVDGANGPASTPYANFQSFTTPTFALDAGPHTITIRGLNDGAATDLIDAVRMTRVVDTTQTSLGGGGGVATAVPLADPSFDLPALPFGGYAYNPTGGGWTFSSSSGVTTNSSPFTWFNAPAPDGQQLAFLQGLGTISQTVPGMAAGSYRISLSVQQRGNDGPIQEFEVLVDGKPVGRFTPAFGGVTPLEWSRRKLPTASSQLAGPGAPGIAWEDMIALANASNTDLWINIPGAASDDYIAQLAKLIKDGDTVGGVRYAGLNPNLKVYVEYSNEVWGGIYAPFVDNYQAAWAEVAAGGSKLDADGTTNIYTWAQRRYLERTMQAATIFRGVFGADPAYDKVRPVLGSQGYNYWYYHSLLPWFAQNYGAPSKYFWGIGTFNYVQATDDSSVDNLIASLYAQLPAQASLATSYATVAHYYGLHLMTYEGGPITSSSWAGSQVSLAAARDPRMEDFIVQLYQTWYAAGADLQTTFDGPFGRYGPMNQFATAEMAQVANPSASAKYRGFVALSEADPTPVTIGLPVAAAGATALPVNVDSIGQGVATSAGQINYWTINVARAGYYDLNLQTPAWSTGGKVAVSLGDSQVLGTYDLGSATAHGLGILALHAGLNTLVLTTLNPFFPAALTLTPAATLVDGGFESSRLSAGSFAYGPSGSSWAFSGSAGLSADGSGFTWQTPSGSQVAFVQNQGSLGQSVPDVPAGSYAISFSAAQRAGFAPQTVRVLVDGVAVGDFRPTGSGYQRLTTATFKLSGGKHTITFQGLNASGDATLLIDDVALAPSATPPPSLVDGGFESSRLAPGSFAYGPSGSSWAFSGSAGLSADGSGFTWQTPSGSQVAFVQNQGSLGQSVSDVPAGSYAISFSAAQRAGFAPQTVRVLVDGVAVGDFRPTGSGYQRLTTATFKLSGGKHTITFQGLNASGDATLLIDDVSLDPIAG